MKKIQDIIRKKPIELSDILDSGDKVQIISLCHNTGQIKLITKYGKELPIKITDLIQELRIDKFPTVAQRGATLFENVLKIKYIEKKSSEYDKIFFQAGLSHIRTIVDEELGFIEVTVQVNNNINRNVPLLEMVT